MMRGFLASITVVCLVAATRAQAETLTLQRAIAMALSGNADVDVSRAAQAEAGAERDAAGRAWMPRVTVEEGWQRGDQPVFVFGWLSASDAFPARFTCRSVWCVQRSARSSPPRR